MRFLHRIGFKEKAVFQTIGQLEYNLKSAQEQIEMAKVALDYGDIDTVEQAVNKAQRYLSGKDGGELTDADCEKLVDALNGF